MGIFDFLKPPPAPSHSREEVEKLLQEMLRIGKEDDFLSEHPGGNFNGQCRHIRARDIGKRLSELGGLELMTWMRERIRSKGNRELAEHLDYCWNDVGGWKA